MLTDAELRETMCSAHHSLFRLETLDRYEVPIDGSDLSVYLAGGEQPPNPEKLAWQEHLRAERAAGIWRHRVHLIDTTHGLGATCATSANGDGDTPRPPLPVKVPAHRRRRPSPCRAHQARARVPGAGVTG